MNSFDKLMNEYRELFNLSTSPYHSSIFINERYDRKEKEVISIIKKMEIDKPKYYSFNHIIEWYNKNRERISKQIKEITLWN